MTGTAIFRYNDEGDWVFTDRIGHDHYPGTVTFGAAQVALFNRLEADEATADDIDAIVLWPIVEPEED